MGDILKSTSHETAAPEYADGGSAALRDNHGNSWLGYDLTCSGKNPILLSFDQKTKLYEDVVFQDWFNLHTDGTIPVNFGMESPLQSMCRNLEAQAHRAPPNKPIGRAK